MSTTGTSHLRHFKPILHDMANITNQNDHKTKPTALDPVVDNTVNYRYTLEIFVPVVDTLFKAI